jgi:GTP-binding protein
MPNAGKSSLLYSLSSSNPRIASYPFTTLHPMIGNALFDDHSQVSICDIPGILRGAHENVGLGLEFLRHIERTTLLCYVIDGSPVEGDKYRDNPCSVFDMLRGELEAYDPTLLSRESLVVCNKMDVEGSKGTLERLVRHCAGLPVLGVSCKARLGLEALALYLRSRVVALQT